jgi:hypothetical protein
VPQVHQRTAGGLEDRGEWAFVPAPVRRQCPATTLGSAESAEESPLLRKIATPLLNLS